MNFFLEKQLIKFSCTYWPLSFCKILKKFLGLIQSYEDVPICHEQFFLVQTIIITFIYLLALFIVQNLKKFLPQIQSYEDAPFLGPEWSICPKFFFGKLLISFSSIYQLLSLCKIFKNPPSRSRVMGVRNFWTQNGPFTQTRIFSKNPLMSLVPFIHAYPHAKNQSQILIYQ